MGGVVSVHLWRELSAEREKTAQLRAGMEELRAERAVPPFVAGPATRELLPGGAAAAVAGSGPVPPSADAPSRTQDQVAGVARSIALSLLDQRELLKDPEYRKSQLAQTRLSIRQNYPGLVEELGLSPEEADRLFNLLAENQVTLSEFNVFSPTGSTPDPAELETMTRRRQEAMQQQEQQLQVMLGGRYGQWEEYQKTRNSRMQVSTLARTFESVGAPITAEQSTSLVNLYIAEQERQREDTSRARALGSDGRIDLARSMEEQANMQVERNQRMLEGARSVLNARQLEALQATLEQQATIARLSARMARQQQEEGAAGAGNASPAAGVVIQVGPGPGP